MFQKLFKLKILIKIKWRIYFRYLKIKQYLWCSWKHENRCYPRVDLPEKESNKHWHCRLCCPCGIGFDYLEELYEDTNSRR